MEQIVCWFSAGITSTIATKAALDKYGRERVDIIFFETGAHHPDNDRFIKECEDKIFLKKVRIEQSAKWKSTWQVFEAGYVNSPKGAHCTKLLKKDMRIKLEKKEKWTHQVFGFEFERKEINRAVRFKEQYPATNPVFPLIELKLSKQDCIRELAQYGVQLPEMYKLGYTNNNCIGCVKGGMGYWNKIRRDFPETFDKMAKIERKVGHTALLETIDGKRVKLYLDTLDPERGREEPPITSECGVICAVEFADFESPLVEKILTGTFKLE